MADDEKYKVRALTRGEIKRLRKDGINIVSMNLNDEEACEKAIDAVVDLVFNDKIDDLDNEPYPVTMALFHKS